MSKLALLRAALLTDRIRVVMDDLITDSDTVVMTTISEAVDGHRIVAVEIWAEHPFLPKLYQTDRIVDERVVLDALFSIYTKLAFSMLRDQIRQASTN